MDLFEILFIMSGCLILWHLLVYPIIMGIIALSKRSLKKNYNYKPIFSIIIPAYNEEKIILNRLRNLEELNYPKDRYEIIVVESGSEDKTYQVVKSYIKNRPHKYPVIRLLREKERRGKLSAVKLGKKYSQGEIILVSDANSIFDKDVLKELAPHFKDPDVGAVGGRFVPIKNNSQEVGVDFYWDWEFLMRLGESQLYSTCIMHGEINAWRKELVNLNPNLISDDLVIPLEVISKGKKIKYEPRAIVYEKLPANKTEEIKQRKKNAIGTIQVTFAYLRFLLTPRLYSAIYFSHKFLQIVLPYLITIFVVSLLWSILELNIFVIYILLAYVLLSVMLLLVLIILIKKAKIAYDLPIQKGNNTDVLSFISKVPGILKYFLMLQYVVVLAWIDYFRGKYSVKWEKVESTRT